MKRFILSLPLLFLAMFLTVGLSSAAPERDPPETLKLRPKSTLLPPLSREVPQTVEDLKTMEKQVEKVLEAVMPSTVCILFPNSSGSGVIVSPDGLVLTAGHVSGTPGTVGAVLLKDGRQLKAKSLGRNGTIDSGMMQILDKGPFPHVSMGTSANMKAGQYCIAVGHPGGPKLNRGMVVRVGRILFNSNSVMRTDCSLVGGDSGGPLFNMRGEVIAIHSRIGPKQMTENMHVPLDTYHQTWERLVKGEAWGGILGQPVLVQSAGGEIAMEKKAEFTSKDPFDAVMKTSYSHLYTFKMTPGFAYTIDMKSKVVDSYLRLEDPSGKILAENDDGGGTQDSRIVYRPSRPGEYRIHATTFDGDQTGAYTLAVRKSEIVVKDLPGGKVKVVEALKIPQPTVKDALGRLLKQGFEPFATAILLDENGKPMAEKEATFQWKSGKTSSMSDDQGQVRVKVSVDKIDDLVLVVPDGMKAMVRITDSEGNPLPLNMGGPKKGKFSSQENEPLPGPSEAKATMSASSPVKGAKRD